MSYKLEVQTSGSSWDGNGVRFATRIEAEKYVKDLMWRWFAVRDTRVVESDDAVNYVWTAEGGATCLDRT